jgi:hypothetical protein
MMRGYQTKVGVIVALAVLVVLVGFLGTQEGNAPSSSAATPNAATLVGPAQVAPSGVAPQWLTAADLALPETPTIPQDGEVRPPGRTGRYSLADIDPVEATPPAPSRAKTTQSPAPFWDDVDALLSTPPRRAIAKAEPRPVYEAVYAETVRGVERPESGAELIVAAETGLGSLNVKNGTSPDAVVILYQGDVQRRAAYVRASDAAAIPKVAAGTYSVRFTSGRSWNGEEFLNEAIFSEFERPLVFAETEKEDGIIFSNFTLTLNPVVGGKERTRQTPKFKLSKQMPLEGR